MLESRKKENAIIIGMLIWIIYVFKTLIRDKEIGDIIYFTALIFYFLKMLKIRFNN